LPPEVEPTFTRLSDELRQARPNFDLADKYYDGVQRFDQLGLAIPPELQNFRVIVNWCRVVADARADRLDPKGFRLPGEDSGDADLWRVWQMNDMDEQDIIARLDYQVYGRSYHCIGANESDADTPLITVESPRQIITDRNPRTREVTAALRLYKGEATSRDDDRATLYLPNETRWLVNDGGWTVVETDDHGLGRVPVVPSFRGRRSTIPAHRTLQGVSAMQDVIPVVDSAARNLTNVQVAQETHAVPARWVAGATKGDFVDSDGNQLPAWESYFGAISATANTDTKFGQFDSSNMTNFETMHTLYAKAASSVTGLRPDYFGLTADTAASADAIRAGDTRLIKSCERDQVVLGNAREEALRIAMQIKDGKRDPELDQMECLWYDAGTPTYASKVDAVVKQYSATDSGGRNLLPAELAFEELGWSPQKIARAMEMRAKEQRNPFLDTAQD
jgi:hypothetical protein